MTIMTDKEYFDSLVNDLNHAVDNITGALCAEWNIDTDDVFWVSNDRTGILCVNDIFLNLADVVDVLKQGLSYEEVWEWQCYNCDAERYGFNTINLRAWHRGAPRVPKETFDRIAALQKNIDNIIDEERKRTNDKCV